MQVIAAQPGRSTPSEALDTEAFRGALRMFATGVTVVTSAGGEPPCGVTANTFTSVSLVPPLVLVCLAATSSAARTIARNGVFAINVLSVDQEWLSRRFAWAGRPRGTAAFDGVPHRTALTGAPILDGVVCWLDCRITDLHLAGDHAIAVGEVLRFDGDATREPLVFHAGRYRAVRNRDAHPAHEPCLPITAEEVNTP
jgi:flavin reductase (DIM6/NTAB) family NADH-FMN oxidoreductase RutF